MNRLSIRARRAALAACATLLPLFAAQAADPAPFDLAGPGLTVQVTRGGRTLPIGRVPALAAGDVVEIGADLPADQSVHYLIVSAFLHGATNPPPKNWIDSAQSWKRKDKDKLLRLVVPDDARQLVLFMVPDTGGDFGTISDVVRGKPGEFVRVTQDLNQASLDRSRLNAFVAGIRAQENSHPEYLRTIAPALSSSLAVKLNEECLAKVVESQAACLLENREALVLGDVHSNSMTETIVGTPADLAFQISATREAGYGFYSPYIGVVRDVARIFGAFSNPEFTYLPALGLQKEAGISLLLNAAPSFRKPKSVLVTALPAIEADKPPPLRTASDNTLCAARSDAVFRVEGAPLIYATDYAHDMRVRMTGKDGRVIDAPVVPRADKGGYMLTTPLDPADFEVSSAARLHGDWGFGSFEGPEFLVQFPQDGGWQVDADAQRLIVGRDNSVPVKGVAPACVESVTMRLPGQQQGQPVKWRVSDAGGIAIDLPLAGAKAGDITLTIKPFGVAKAASVSVRAYAEASRIDGLLLHAGDDRAVLTGLRLDQISALTLGDARFLPDGLSRQGDVDKLQLRADTPDKARSLAAGQAMKAQVALSDGRSIALPVTIAAPRPAATIIAKSIEYKDAPAPLAIDVTDPDLLPDTARLTVSVRAADGQRMSAQDGMEIATQEDGPPLRLTAANGLRLESPQVAIARFDPATLGPSAFGPLRFRLVQGGVAGDWQPLATLARLPMLQSFTCAPDGGPCRLMGQNLFLVDAIADNPAFDRAVTVPRGFTGSAIDLPAPPQGQGQTQGRKLYLKLRDAPASVQAVTLPGG